MKIEMYQRVRLKNGKCGHVVEIFNGGEAYLVDVRTDDEEYETETVYPTDIQSVFVETEKPFSAAG